MAVELREVRSREVSEVPLARRQVMVDDSPPGRAPARAKERVRNRAATLAQRLGLSAGGEEALCAVLLEEQKRRAAAFRELRRGSSGTGARALVRKELDAILAWKTRELRTRFGTERADAMMRR